MPRWSLMMKLGAKLAIPFKRSGEIEKLVEVPYPY